MFSGGILKQYSSSISLLARLADAVMTILIGVAAYAWYPAKWPMGPQYTSILILAALLVMLIFPLFGLYHSWRGRGMFHEVRQYSLAWGTVVVSLILLTFLTKSSADYSRVWVGSWSLVGWVALVIFHILLRFVLRWIRQNGYNVRRVAIVGAGELGRNVVRHLHEAPWTGFVVTGFYDDNPELSGQSIYDVNVNGAPEKLIELVRSGSIDEVWLALPLRAEVRVKEIMAYLRNTTVNVRFVPDIFGFTLLNHSVGEVAGVPVLNLNTSPMMGINRLLKAIEDRMLATLILILASPLILLIAIGVKFASRGPVIFRQQRHGWDGKPIVIYKFRTMVVHAEPDGCLTQCQRLDVRVTRFGAFLRRTSLDELPQFINVLQGRMSIVGPRPHAMEHNEQYKELIDDYMQRHKVKPGITGWAQVNGWRGETDTLEKMKKRVEYDLQYISNWSLWFDLKIIFITLFKGFVHKNAY